MTIDVDLAIYPLDVVLRAAHPFTARYFVTPRIIDGGIVAVSFARRDDACAEDATLAGEFANALLDARLRTLIADETRAVRELLVAQAFCEGDLLDRENVEGDEYDDPRGIAS